MFVQCNMQTPCQKAKKHAKGSVFRYLGYDVARRGSNICLLFNQTFFVAQYLGNQPICMLAHKGRWSDACFDKAEIWQSAAVTVTSWLTMIRSRHATGRDV